MMSEEIDSMGKTFTLHTHTDEHGATVKEPVLVTVPGSGQEDMTQICDIGLLEQLADYGGSLGVVRDGNLGDLLMLTPALRELKRQLPDLNLHMFCGGDFTRVFKGLPYVETCQTNYSKAAREMAYTADLRGIVERDEDSATVDRTSLFGRAFGIEIEDGKTDFVVEEEDCEKASARVDEFLVNAGTDKLVILGPDSADKRRNLSDKFVDRFVRIAGQNGYAVFVTGNTRGERPELGELAAMMGMAEFIVSSDNGVYHLSAAVCDTPTFPLFTSIRPELRCCWYDNSHPLTTGADCGPCNEDPTIRCAQDCVSSFDAEEVLGHIQGVVANSIAGRKETWA